MTRRALLASAFVMLGAAIVTAQQTGSVAGVAVDGQSGDPLVGATVVLENTNRGTICDLEGGFQLFDVPPGTYTLICTMIGYQTARVLEVEVQAGAVATLELGLQPEAIQLAEEVVVQATAGRNTGASLLRERQKAPAVSDAISSEEIGRAGSGNAAEAMAHVTGASVVGGKYVYIRGLGERYSSVQLNGAALPSADPNKRAVPMDLIPANLLDNIVTTKSFTPDKPGDFTGGSIDIGTRAFPERFTLSVSTSTQYNSQTTLSDAFLTYEGGDTDWLGLDDGTRDLPAVLASGAAVPDISYAWTNPEVAAQLDALSKSFSPVMAPTTKTAPFDYSSSVSLGNQIRALGRPLGLLATVTHSRSHAFYEDGRSGRWQLTSGSAETLTNNFLLSDARGSEEIAWGSLLTASYKLRPTQEISATYMYNRSAEDVARYLAGTFPRDLTESAVYETRVLHFTERALNSFQLTGKHQFPQLRTAPGLRVDWAVSTVSSDQSEPDLRYFTDNYITQIRPLRDENGDLIYDTAGNLVRGEVTSYAIRPDIYPLPTRYFRQLEESNREARLDIALPFRQWHGLSSSIKVGGLVLDKERDFSERRYEFRQDDIAYDGDQLGFFAPENVGIVDSTGAQIRFGNYVRDSTQLSGNFTGDQQVYAAYGMLELPLSPLLRLIAGSRLESTRLDVASMDSTKTPGRLSADDLLPSLNMVYEVQPGMNVRASYGRTLARPTFRELAPYASFDFVGSFIFIGNENLKRTLVDNYDLRWEWFGKPGEIRAVSLFYKDFRNPIERAILTINGEVQFQNVHSAQVYGLELEGQQSLALLHPRLENLHVGGNISLVESRVSIPERELQIRRSLIPDAADTRALQGQSPYVANVDLSYENYLTGLSAGIYYNVFGRRLAEVSLGGTPDVYEEARGLLSLTLSKRFAQAYRIKLGAKNLLDPKTEFVYRYNGQDYVAQSYRAGRTFSVGLSYTIGR